MTEKDSLRATILPQDSLASRWFFATSYHRLAHMEHTDPAMAKSMRSLVEWTEETGITLETFMRVHPLDERDTIVRFIPRDNEDLILFLVTHDIITMSQLAVILTKAEGTQTMLASLTAHQLKILQNAVVRSLEKEQHE